MLHPYFIRVDSKYYIHCTKTVRALYGVQCVVAVAQAAR